MEPNLHRLIIENFTSLINDLIPKNANIPTDESSNIASLLSLFLNPSKDMNPHDIMRKLSDPLIEHIIANREKMPEHKVMKMVFQLFLIEWMYRNDFLNQDWEWQWDENGKSGSVHMDTKIDISKIPLPKTPI